MKNLIKNILGFCLLLLPFVINYSVAAVWDAPAFSEFTKFFTNWYVDEHWEIIDVRAPAWVSADKSLQDNIRCLFYPNSYMVPWCDGVTRGWSIWTLVRYIWYALVVLFIVIAGIKLLMNWSSAEKVKAAFMSLLYILLWSILFFGCIWILWSVLKIETLQWTEWLNQNLQWDQSSFLFIVLSFLKALAFIAAILMIVVHGFRVLSSADKSDKVKAWLKWLLNVIIALVIIKVIDYVYYIAQLSDFVTEATTLIIEIAKVVWFIIWALMMIMLFYAGFLFITDQWSSENMKKAKNIIVWILVTAIVIFSLLLIIYEIFNEFA